MYGKKKRLGLWCLTPLSTMFVSLYQKTNKNNTTQLFNVSVFDDFYVNKINVKYLRIYI